ncbi:MAG: hypothetical protein N3E51_01280 [Candidatus Micrarchaeota archaeon]|nr:hypothetical protein [Candidatus Micrarchaeota archaeon]
MQSMKSQNGVVALGKEQSRIGAFFRRYLVPSSREFIDRKLFNNRKKIEKRILRDYAWLASEGMNNQQIAEKIGKKLGFAPETVLFRIAHLEKIGAIKKNQNPTPTATQAHGC